MRYVANVNVNILWQQQTIQFVNRPIIFISLIYSVSQKK